MDGHRRRARSRAAARLLGDGPGSLLEIGMGSGRLLTTLAGRGWSVTGIDPSPEMVELARARLPEGAQLAEVAAESLPRADAEFDAAVAVGVLEYTDVRATLRELARVVRTGGRLVLGFSNRASPTHAWRRAVVHPLAGGLKRRWRFGDHAPGRRVRPPSLAQIHDLLASHDLRVELIETVGAEVLPDPLDRLLPGPAYRVAGAAERRPGLRRTFGSDRLVLARRA